MISRMPVILCVDDQESNLKLLENILIPRGYEVITAESGKEALAKIESERVDLVLLDIMMPEMDGFEVCRKIKENKRLANIPVIMITALTAKQERVKGIEAGAEEFLSKPFDQTEVLARIKMLLKVKELSDKLNYSYDNITSLANFGEEIISTFNPLEFDFMSKIDSIISRVLRQQSDVFEKPETVLVCIRNDKHVNEWFRYEFVLGKLEKMPFQIALEINLPKVGDSHLYFYNQDQLGNPAFKAFVTKLNNFNITLNNMVCYRGNNLSVFALNYGKDVSLYDAEVLNSIVVQTLFLQSLAAQVKDTEDAFEYTVQSLARASEVNDEDTGKHILRVGVYCELLARWMKCSERFINDIRIQAPLHDVGKIHTPSAILKKPGRLSMEEWIGMKSHCTEGAKIVGGHPRLKLANSIALTHHERYDGSGYPRGLSGENIPIEGRIITIADQYDALRNSRVYKDAIDHKTTCEILTKGDGRTMPQHFDPLVLRGFIELAPKFEEVYEKFKG